MNRFCHYHVGIELELVSSHAKAPFTPDNGIIFRDLYRCPVPNCPWWDMDEVRSSSERKYDRDSQRNLCVCGKKKWNTALHCKSCDLAIRRQRVAERTA